MNFCTFHQMNTQERVAGLPQFSKVGSLLCATCAHGKYHRGAFPVNDEGKRVSKPSLFFHCDISGPFQVISHDDHSYFITFKDDHSSFCFDFFWLIALKFSTSL